MIQFHPCTLADHPATIQLIVSTFKPPMLEEFPLLLGLSNLHHMWIAKDEDRVVAVVNYYVTPVHLNQVTLSVASIGAVATHLDYRGQKLSSHLLELAELQMIEEGVDMVVISGDLPHYRRFGADPISLMDTFTVEAHPTQVSLRPYLAADLPVLHSMHEQLPYRYGRTSEEMGLLIGAALTPDPWWDTYVDCIVHEGSIKGYMVYAIEKNHGTAYVHELVGQTHCLLHGCAALYQRHPHVTDVKLELIHNDPLVDYAHAIGWPSTRKSLEHTSKIIRFNAFINKFIVAMKQRHPHTKITIEERDGHYYFRINDTSFVTASLSVAQAIIFGPFPKEVEGLPIKKELEKLFPVPFVYPHNLNYQ